VDVGGLVALAFLLSRNKPGAEAGGRQCTKAGNRISTTPPAVLNLKQQSMFRATSGARGSSMLLRGEYAMALMKTSNPALNGNTFENLRERSTAA